MLFRSLFGLSTYEDPSAIMQHINDLDICRKPRTYIPIDLHEQNHTTNIAEIVTIDIVNKQIIYKTNDLLDKSLANLTEKTLAVKTYCP